MTKKTHTAARAADMYYTQPQTVSRCLAHLRESLPLDGVDLFLEPSAGAGAFLEQMPSPKLGMDTQPMASGIETADYLTWWPETETGTIAVVGNPPFGRNGAAAVKFFNHSAGFADVIAMIMPASFSKDSMQNRLSMDFVLVSEMSLQKEAFLVEGKPHRVNAVFQVWRRSATPRVAVKSATKHSDFAFVATKEEADFAMRRVGGVAGAIIEITPEACNKEGLSSESNYFIKAVNCTPAALKARLKSLDFAEVRSQCAAVPTISKPDIVKLYTAHIAAAHVADAPAVVQSQDTLIGLVLTHQEAPKSAHADMLQDIKTQHTASQPSGIQSGSDTAPDHDPEFEPEAVQSDWIVDLDTPDAALEKAGVKLPAEQAVERPPANDAAPHNTPLRSTVRGYGKRVLRLLNIAP
ncbi:MAG: hypothetical protein KKC72_10640 [Alphaproteobacteria bacterium]|nr:hypothetical protein [Alphaproteobacteria bacterium]MBU1835519.1 hypothetical protein [Alphaproteobacteria bacterium]